MGIWRPPHGQPLQSHMFLETWNRARTADSGLPSLFRPGLTLPRKRRGLCCADTIGPPLPGTSSCLPQAQPYCHLHHTRAHITGKQGNEPGAVTQQHPDPLSERCGQAGFSNQPFQGFGGCTDLHSTRHPSQATLI